MSADVTGASGPTPRHFKIDLGHCDGRTLQTSSTTSFVRCVDDLEAKAIQEAAHFCRKYATNPTHRLLRSAYLVWKQTYGLVAETKQLTPDIVQMLEGAFAGWLLVWRLVLDHAAHDISKQFGDPSAALLRFESATHVAYDTYLAYRLVDALRNEVQHREMPPLRLNRTGELDPKSGQTITRISYKFPVSHLLESPKCKAAIKREFTERPTEEFELPQVIDNAMTAMDTVLLALTAIWVPDLNKRILYLRGIFAETAPDSPLLLRLSLPLAGSRTGGSNLQIEPLVDLMHLVQNAPVPTPKANP